MRSFEHWRSALVGVSVALILVACATPHGGRAPVGEGLGSYALEARFGLKGNDASYSGRLSWRHDAIGDAVLVQDPFGGGLAELFAGPQGSRMQLADGRVIEAVDSRVLMHDLTGIELPIRDLARWLTGREPNRKPGVVVMPPDQFDEFGRVVRIARQGWQFEYRYDGEAKDALPSRVLAVNGQGIELRLAIESWGNGEAR